MKRIFYQPKIIS
uniref:Uncharacterized protein n=1 Tax=Rhizophora mucronata TaxID=61149 RepID=A0A2P2Q077_RHIMU